MIGAMISLGRRCGNRRIFSTSPRVMSTFRTSIVDSQGSKSVLLYTGPLNGLIFKLKRASLASGAFTLLGAPLGLYYLGPESWSWVSNTLFLIGGSEVDPFGHCLTTHLLCSAVNQCATILGVQSSHIAIRYPHIWGASRER